MKKKNYSRTLAACFLGISNQAVTSNLTAVLFVHFMLLYDFQLWQLGVLVGINFGAQMLADIILTFWIDKAGFRPLVLAATLLSTAGILIYGLFAFIVPAAGMFTAIIIATVLFAISGGMCEVLLSPIVDNIPGTVHAKPTALSLMHSFYAWGQVACVAVTAVFLMIAGPEYWGYIVLFFAAVPAASFILFLHAPLDKKKSDQSRKSIKKVASSPYFIIAVLAILLVGASEVTINQWVSTFLVKSLAIEKSIADLFGMCLFAAGIGIGRAVHVKYGHHWNLTRILTWSSLLTAVLYAIVGLSQIPALSIVASVMCGLTVSLSWPGTLTVTSQKFPLAGAWIFAIMAIFGDVGAAVVPMAAGFMAESMGLNSTFLILAAVPFCAFLCHFYLLKNAAPVTKEDPADAVYHLIDKHTGKIETEQSE